MAASLRKHKKLGDEEFIEAVRADLAKRRRQSPMLRIAGLLLLVSAAACLVVLPVWLMSRLWGMGEDGLQIAMMGGLSMGAAGATFILLGVRLIQESKINTPADRMAGMLAEREDADTSEAV